MPLSICIVGDLTYDAVTHLTDIKINEIRQSFYNQKTIKFLVGGTALNPAITAKKSGFSEVYLVSMIGVDPDTQQPDFSASEMIKCLKRNNIKYHLIPDGNAPTGKTMISYFAEDQRILVADRAANKSFNTEQITPELIDIVIGSDILFVSGYWLMLEEQAKATLYLMRESKANSRLVVLDIVPHRIYEILTLDKFLAYTQYVDVLVGEVNTVARLFPELEHFIDSFSDSSEVAETILENYHYSSLILMPTNDLQYVAKSDGIISSKLTGYSGAPRDERRGFVDGSTMQILYDYYDQLNQEE